MMFLRFYRTHRFMPAGLVASINLAASLYYWGRLHAYGH